MRPFQEWDEVGARVAEAREAQGLTQAQLAAAVGLDRTALAKIERGRRSLNSLELARLAEVLRRPIEWFVAEAPPAVLSRRSELSDARVTEALEVELERAARDVALLVEIGALPAVPARDPRSLRSFAQAEQLASEVRQEIGRPDGLLAALDRVADQLGMYAFMFDLGAEAPDGAYVALEGAGVAVINGSMATGRRRFTLAHELGHHVLSDAYSSDYSLQDEMLQVRERMLNAFAIHLLMPRSSITRLWQHELADQDVRDRAIRVAAEYRVSWTAACAQLKNLGLVNERERRALLAHPPGRADYMEQGLFIVEELLPPALSPRYVSAALKAYRGNKISDSRVVELLRGTLEEDELPPPNEVPLAALRGELST